MANNRELSQFANVVGYSGGNIGIGTDNPSGKLNIAGSDSQLLNLIQDSGDLQIRLNDRGVGSAYIKVPDNTSASLTFETGGSERLRIHADGEVECKGGGAAQNALLVTGNYSSGNNVDIQTWQRSGGAVQAKLIYKDADTSVHFGTDTAHKLCLMTGGTERLRITSAGLVGINDSGPNFDLDVDGNIGIREGQVLTWHDGSGGKAGDIYMDSSDNFIIRNTSSVSERLRITSTGKVLINSTDNSNATMVVKTLTDNTHPIIKFRGTNANGYTFLGDEYLTDESQFTMGLAYSGASLVTGWGVKVSTSANDTYLSSQDTYSTKHSATKHDGSGWRFLSNSTSQTVTLDATVTLTERLRINPAGQMILGTATNLGSVPPKLTIVNDTNSSTFSECQLLRLNGPGAVGERGGIGFHYANSLNYGEKPSAFIGNEIVAPGGAQQSDLIFATRPNTNNVEPTERLRITSDGYVTKPNHPCFDAVKSNGHQNSTGYIVYNSVNTNNGSHYSSSNGRFTAPVAGYYFFSYGCIKNGTDLVTRLHIHKNGSQVLGSRHLRMDNGQDYGDNGAMTVVIQLAKNDYIQIYLSAGAIYSVTTEYTFFNGYLLG